MTTIIPTPTDEAIHAILADIAHRHDTLNKSTQLICNTFVQIYALYGQELTAPLFDNPYFTFEPSEKTQALITQVRETRKPAKFAFTMSQRTHNLGLPGQVVPLVDNRQLTIRIGMSILQAIGFDFKEPLTASGVYRVLMTSPRHLNLIQDVIRFHEHVTTCLQRIPVILASHDHHLDVRTQIERVLKELEQTALHAHVDYLNVLRPFTAAFRRHVTHMRDTYALEVRNRVLRYEFELTQQSPSDERTRNLHAVKQIRADIKQHARNAKMLRLLVERILTTTNYPELSTNEFRQWRKQFIQDIQFPQSIQASCTH